MRISKISITDIVILLLALAFSSCLLKAADGRDFAGNFSLTGVSRTDANVRLTLTLRLFNYSGAGLHQAFIEVHSAQQGGELLGTLEPAADWAANRDVVAAGEFTLTPDEYRYWSSRSPNVFVTYPDSHGEPLRGWVQLTRRPLISGAPPPSLRRLSTNGE